MSEATIDVPAEYAEGIQGVLTAFLHDATNALARIERGEEPEASAEYIGCETRTSKEAAPLVGQGRKQKRAKTVTYTGSARQLSNALDYRMGDLGEILSKHLMTSPVDYKEVSALLAELNWLNCDAERVDTIDRKAVVA